MRLVCPATDIYDDTVNFYRAVLGRPEDEACGSSLALQQSVVWRLADGIDLIVTRDREVPPEAFVAQGQVWICFDCEDPDAAWQAASARGLELLNDPIDTAFGTRAFYIGDPADLPVYVGGAWPRPENPSP